MNNGQEAPGRGYAPSAINAEFNKQVNDLGLAIGVALGDRFRNTPPKPPMSNKPHRMLGLDVFSAGRDKKPK